MTRLIAQVRNIGLRNLRLILEPYPHYFDIVPNSTVEVKVEQEPPDNSILIEYGLDEITLYAGGVVSIWFNDTELAPKFR